jgi:hypothetical protein
VGDPVGPFTEPGLWLRCALHAHTTNSDGELAPDALARHYARAGYDVLAITDHWLRSSASPVGELIVIPSAELNAQAGGPAEDAHLLALGIDAEPVAPEHQFAPLAETVAWILAHGGVPYIAHTTWSGLRSPQFEDVEGLVGLEVWNAGCELELGRGAAAAHWDEALERGHRLFGIATDDSHHPGFDSALASTWVRARERNAGAVLDALRAGSFYSSTGPVLRSIELDERTVVVHCSPAASVTLFAGRRAGARVNAGRLGYPHHGRVLETNDDGLITTAELRRPAQAPYGRVEIVDRGGQRAWSNPLWS